MEENDDNEPLAARLAKLWLARDREGFCTVVMAEALPALCRIVMVGLSLQQSDAEDCVAEALEAFLARPDGDAVLNPYAYLKRSCWNNGVTLHRRARRFLIRSVEALSPSAGPDASDELIRDQAEVPDDWAVVALEETIGDIEAEGSWATAVIEEALGRLTATQQRLIRYLSTLPFDFPREDFEVQSKKAALALGMKPDAFRKAKQRAYEALRDVIPQVVSDLRVTPPARYAAAFEESRGSFMDEQIEDDEG